MNALYKFLFPGEETFQTMSIAILGLRIVFGVLLMTHGITKWTHFSELSATFPDPLGIGSQVSVMLVIFAELFCAIAVVLGLFTRLALIPILFNFFVIVFIVHMPDTLKVKELPLLYLGCFVMLFIMGPGKYSVDFFIRKILLRE